MNSPAYEIALGKARVASAAFGLAQEAYRSRKIGDAEFLAARQLYLDSDAAFDIAFALEEKQPVMMLRNQHA
jgi:hypothetical protein